MAGCRFDLIAPDGELIIDDAMLSASDSSNAEETARKIAADFGEGYTARVWFDTDLAGTRTERPDAEVTA